MSAHNFSVPTPQRTPRRGSQHAAERSEVVEDPNLVSWPHFSHHAAAHPSQSHSTHPAAHERSSGWHHVPTGPYPQSAPAGHVPQASSQTDFAASTVDLSTPLIHASGLPRHSSHGVGPYHTAPMSHNPSQQSAFDLAHGRKNAPAREHVPEINEAVPVRFAHLFKRPVVRQWLHDGQLWRECGERTPSRFELFFDLVFVGSISQLAHGAAETSSWVNVVKFLVLFFPAWSVWTDVCSFLNVHGSDDIAQRCYILVVMCILCGYTANATGIKIDHAKEGVVVGSETVNIGTLSEAPVVNHRALDFVLRKAFPTIARRAGDTSSSGQEELLLVKQVGSTVYWFAQDYERAIAAAVAFYLTAKALRLALYFLYGVMLPRFRKPLFLHTITLVVISAIYLPLVFTTKQTSPALILWLAAAGLIVELLSRYFIAAAMQVSHGRAKHRGRSSFIPALSIEHLMERMMLFVILATGEILIVSCYTATSDSIGPVEKFWRASLSIVIAFNVIWLYFDADASRTFAHALRRHWWHSITWTHLHFPLVAAIVLLASALSQLITQDHVSAGYEWYLGGSLAVIMLSMATIGLLHKNLDVRGSSLIPHWFRVMQRFAVAAAFAMLPIRKTWSSISFLGACAGLLSLQVIVETVGKIGAVGRRYDPERTAALRAARQEASRSHAPSSCGDEKQIGMSQLSVASPSPAGSSLYPERRGSSVHLVRRMFDKDYSVPAPTSRDGWHEWEDLTEEEIGEEDVGVESALGSIEAKYVSSGQRWAYAAT